jgi:2-(3-amino-3-carboxypropyl)histidine synthase
VRRNFPSSRQAFHRAILNASSSSQTPSGSKIPITLESDEISQRDKPSTAEDQPTRLALVSTIQFVAAIQSLREDLSDNLPEIEMEPVGDEVEGMVAKVKKMDLGVWRGKYEVTIPQSRPLSPGEVLGCTAPKLQDVEALM